MPPDHIRSPPIATLDKDHEIVLLTLTRSLHLRYGCNSFLAFVVPTRSWRRNKVDTTEHILLTPRTSSSFFLNPLFLVIVQRKKLLSRPPLRLLHYFHSTPSSSSNAALLLRAFFGSHHPSAHPDKAAVYTPSPLPHNILRRHFL